MPQLITPASREAAPAILPLENGDRLSRVEFERRYEAMPDVKKAELIRGVVYIPSPVRHDYHAFPHFRLNLWAGTYYAATPGLEGGDNGSVRLGDEDEPQPDTYLIIASDRGKTRREDGYIVGAPEFVAEVAASSASIDLHSKFEVYAENGVQEYLVWRVLEDASDWFALDENQFRKVAIDSNGLYRSRVFPGLWLDPQALIIGDIAKVLQVLQQGINTPEHADFVRRLGHGKQTGQ